MADWPITNFPAPNIISPYSHDSCGGMLNMLSFITAPASATLTQNQAYYFPFWLEQEATAKKMAVQVGATSNGTVDAGIYDEQFNYVISSGATGQGSINAVQELDITDTVLPPGNYWMALSLSSATGTVFRLAASDEIAIPQAPCLTQASAHPLPTTVATPVKSPDSTTVYAINMAVAFDTLI